MDAKATVKTLMDAVQTADFKKAKSLLTDNFQFSGPVPEPVNGEQWLGISGSLKTAFPNLDYRFAISGAEGKVVHISAQLSGTHSGSLDLTGMGMGVIPATGKSFSATRESGNVTVEGDKVASWVNQPTEGAGLTAVLSQLGIKAK
jgi:SnoaL-like polyketide cyclase